MRFVIRRASPEDEEWIERFLDQYLRKDWFMPRSRMRKVLGSKSGQVLLAFSEGELVGVAIAGGKRKTLYNLLVHPGYRKKSIGSDLLAAMDPVRVRAKTNMSTGDPTPFYEKAGYRAIFRDARRTHITILERPVKTGEQLTTDQLERFTPRPDLVARMRRSTPAFPRAIIDANIFVGLQGPLVPSHPVAQLHRRALSGGQLSIHVTPELEEEINRDQNETRRVDSLSEFAKFPVVPPVEELRLQATAEKLQGIVFPNANPIGRRIANKVSDCRQLAHAAESSSTHFVTYDGDILRRAPEIKRLYGLDVVKPEDLLQVLDHYQPRTPKVGPLVYPHLKIRQGTMADWSRVLASLQMHGDSFRVNLRPDIGGTSRLRVTEVNNELAAVLLMTESDPHFAEVTLLWVAPKYRRRGLGQHLLHHSMNAAIAESVQKMTVKIPIKHGYLTRFFSRFGFRVEGTLPHPSSEMVSIQMSKSFLHRYVTQTEWTDFIDSFLRSILVLRPTLLNGVWEAVPHFGSSPSRVRVESSLVENGASIKLYDSQTGAVVDAWDTYQLESELSPLQLHYPERRAAVIPIQPQWAEALFEWADPQLRLIRSEDKRKLRFDNVYYRSGRDDGRIRRGTPVVWYVSAGKAKRFGSGGLVACSKVISVEFGQADELFERYQDLGVYSRQDVLRAGQSTAGRVQVIRFDQVESFQAPLGVRETLRVLKSIPQTARAIPYETYLELRRLGGLIDYR